MTKKQIERKEAIEKLHGLIEPGDVIYTNMLHVSKPGMYRVMDVFIIKDNIPLRLTWSVADAIQERYDRKHEGIGVTGCGMDMGFHVVYNLSRVLYPQGFDCIGEKCRSNDHSNGDRDRSFHLHKDGGYALIHKWL